MTGGRIYRHIRGNAVGYVAVFIALTGTAIATDGPLAGTNTVGSEDIIGNEIKSDDIANGRIFNLDLADNAINGQKVSDSSLTSSDIVDSTLFNDNSLQADDLNTNSVDANEIVTGAVNSSEIETNAVAQNELGDNSVDSAAVLSDTLGAGDLNTNSVGSDEILINAVGASELGAVIVREGSVNVPANTTQEVIIACPAGFVAIGGGGTGAIHSGAFADIRLIGSAPSDSEGFPLEDDNTFTHWVAVYHNGGVATEGTNSYAICLD